MAIWSEALACYLAELYVVPAYRGHGLGRALMNAAIARAREQGADHIDLNTSHDDVAARALYGSLGFSNREGRPDGPVTYSTTNGSCSRSRYASSLLRARSGTDG
jgi:ribosomal protein S18 acetylase RimI-like enzyme